MRRAIWTTSVGGLLLLGSVPLLLAAPASADVKAGVDAWQQGDYVRAIGEWRGLADAGDPDAQFNMGQAYRLGRGVPPDNEAAITWFCKAAEQGHAKAENNCGQLLFNQGRRDAAMPYLERSATRGEALAQYFFGTALFNGEYVQKDWVRAYAMMTRAAASGLERARTSLAQMDNFIPADQRQKGTAMAATLPGQQQADIASTNLGPPTPSRISPPVRTAELPPSTATGRFQPRAAPPAVTAAPAPAPHTSPPAAPRDSDVAAPARSSAPAVAAPAASGKWRVQLGAFSEESRARSLWSSLGTKIAGLSAYQPYLVKAGAVTRLQAGPLANSADAAKLCAKIKAAGSDCIPKAPE